MTSTGLRRRWAAVQSASPIAKTPTATTTMPMPSGQLERAAGEPGLRGGEVEADQPDGEAHEEADEAAELRRAEHAADQHHRQQHDREVGRRPIFTACSARAGVKNATSRVPMVPAMNDPIAAVASACAARPRLAILLPSIAVITDADSPGVLSRIEVVEPPYMPP